jgi:hypothetical protein
MATLTAPARSPRTGRWAARTRSSPGRLAQLMLGLAVLGLVAGLSATVGTSQRAGLVDAVGRQSGPLAVQAQALYHALSDADATAASAFLSNGVEPPALRDRYRADIAAASAALAAVTEGGASDRAAVELISAQLPVYTGIVDTARADNRLGLPLGAAYLREASGLMRQQLLPAAERLYRTETDLLRADRSGGGEFPWLAVPLLVLTLVGLALAQRHLLRRTNRLVNLGLAAASLAALVMLVWTGWSWLIVHDHLDKADRAGSAQVDLLAQARIAALQARADEALTLVARGSGADFEKDFGAAMTRLAGPDGNDGLLKRARDRASDPAVIDAALSDARAWGAAHQKVRGLDDGGNYPDAVKLAIGDEPAGAAAAFSKLDADLNKDITAASGVFDREAAAAGGGFAGAVPGLAVLTLFLAAGVVYGLGRRIAEYR